MPKLAATSVHEYRSRISELEGQVSTLKKRLDELRRAKFQAVVKPTPPTAPARPPPTPPDPRAEEIRALNQRVTRLTNELELSELRHARDTGELRAVVGRLEGEMGAVRAAAEAEVTELRGEQGREVALLKRRHTEELAAYTESSERDKRAKIEAERELAEYRARVRAAPAVEILRAELLTLQAAHARLRAERDATVGALEERVEELEGEVSALRERPRRQFQLIPDRTYIVKHTGNTPKHTSPTASSTSCSSGGEPSSTVPTAASRRGGLVDAPPPASHPPRPKSTPAVGRAKSSCGLRKAPVRPPEQGKVPPLTRPKSCWSDQRGSGNQTMPFRAGRQSGGGGLVGMSRTPSWAVPKK